MDVLITIQHPAHVHFFRNAIEELEDDGHTVHVYALDKDIALELLDAYDIDHEVLGARSGSITEIARSQLAIEFRLLREARRIDPDVMTAIGGLTAAHVSTILDIPSVIFSDTEHARVSNSLTFPLATELWTPDCYRRDEGDNHRRYAGFHELAYLHPDRFTPDPSVLEAHGIDPEDPFVVMRHVGWDAVHDIGDSGLEGLAGLVEQLERAGVTVYITAEGDLEEGLQDRQVTVSPEDIHHLMAYADLFVGESPTMATESAVLGTPAVYVHSQEFGYTAELDAYGLLDGFHGPDRNERAARRAIDLVEEPHPSDWDVRREELVDDKVDTTNLVVNRLEAVGAD